MSGGSAVGGVGGGGLGDVNEASARGSDVDGGQNKGRPEQSVTTLSDPANARPASQPASLPVRQPRWSSLADIIRVNSSLALPEIQAEQTRPIVGTSLVWNVPPLDGCGLQTALSSARASWAPLVGSAHGRGRGGRSETGAATESKSSECADQRWTEVIYRAAIRSFLSGERMQINHPP